MIEMGDGGYSHRGGGKSLIFMCPITNEAVRHKFETRGSDYEAVRCLACTRVHFIDLRTELVVKSR